MPNGKAPVYLTLLAVAVLGAAVFWLQPYSAEWPGAGYTKPAQRYLQAAIRQDSNSLVRFSASPTPVIWALKAARTHGAALETWAHGAQAWVGARQADTAEVFVFNASDEVCPQSPITLRFVGSGTRARVLGASSACWATR